MARQVRRGCNLDGARPLKAIYVAGEHDGKKQHEQEAGDAHKFYAHTKVPSDGPNT
jgi:hypothetical protein